MAEEPDDGRENGSGRARQADWPDLQPAVRRVADSADDVADVATDTELPTSDGDTEPATDDTESTTDDTESTTDDSPGGRPGWPDLKPAVRRIDEDTSDDDDPWEWTTEDLARPDLQPGESTATNPELLAEQSHQTDDAEGRDATGHDVVDPDHAPTAGDDGLVGSAPETDEEAPLAEHVEEMVKRLAIVIAIAGLASVAVFPLTEGLITTIWNQVLPGGESVDPRVYHPLELVITQLKVASLAGLVVALPAFVYESYAFMRPGLYENERRYYLAAIPTSLVLAVLGVLFAYLLVLPYTMDYFHGYTQPTADVAFALGTTFNLILMVMGYLAVVFQIPLFIMLAIMLGVTSREWLESRRLLFWAAFAGISFTFGAIDPTGVVPIIVALTMIALFEATLALLRWTGN